MSTLSLIASTHAAPGANPPRDATLSDAAFSAKHTAVGWDYR
jgi:hypothetical protein